MVRIVVFEINGKWTFSPGAGQGQSWGSVLDAANAAVEYGETRRGEALGYVLRLLHDCGGTVDGHNLVLHTHTFADEPRVRSTFGLQAAGTGSHSHIHSTHARAAGVESPGIAHANLDGAV